VEPYSKKPNARNTTELGQAAKQVPSEQPIRFDLLNVLESTTKFIGHLLVIFLIVALASSIAADVRNKRILIDPVIVPKAMEDQGYTGLVAANRIADEIDRIEQSTKTRAPTDKFDLNIDSVPDIEMPETKLSLNSTKTFLEDFLGIAPRHVSVELIFESGVDWQKSPPAAPGMERLIISVRINGKDGYGQWSEVTVRNPDEAVTRTARQILEMTDPYLLGTYADFVDHDLPTAINLMRKASDQNPSNSLIYIGWGIVLDEERDYDGAIAKYRQALTLNPKYADAYNNWGIVLAEKEDYDGAITRYRQALTLNPKDANAYNNWGNALYVKRDYDGAITRYRQALTLNPNNASAYNNWGIALAEKQDYDSAITKYRQALTLNPKYAGAYYNWGNALRHKQDYDGAITRYQQALTLNPRDANAYNNWGIALYAKQDYDGAIAKYRQALTLNPNSELFRNNLALAKAKTVH
jgi:tetratricopeptide (TPR) repeat protein